MKTDAVCDLPRYDGRSELVETDSALAHTFSQAAVGMAHVSQDGSFLLLNKKFCEIAGYCSEELLCLRFQDITYPDDLQADLEYAHQLIAGTLDTYSIEKRYVRKDASLVWINLTASIVRNRDGRPRYFIAVIEDISRRKLAEEELLATRALLEAKVRERTADLEIVADSLRKEIVERNLLEAERIRFFTISQDAMIVFDMGGKLKRLNPAFSRILGYSEEELLSREVFELIHPEDLEATKRAGATLRADQSFSGFENRYFHKDGRIVHFSWSATTFAEQNLIYANGRDITAQKLAEQMLQEERIKVLAASKIHALGRMAAGVAHEINNPLTVVYGQACQMRTQIKLGTARMESIYEAAGQIERMSLRIVDIVSGLRTFAREGSNDPFAFVSLKHIVSDTLSFCQGKMQSEGIRLSVAEIPENIEIHCRAVQISQVLLNLLNNARDAIEGLDEKEISIDFICEAGEVGLAVNDNGRGLSVLARSRLFEPFFTTKEVGKGTGLGLSVSKGIVKSHGGRIFCDTIAPRGTRFTFTLPSVSSDSQDRSL